MEARDLLIALSLKYNGDWTLIYDALSNKTVQDENELKTYLKKNHYKTLTMLDSDYPECLKQVYKPPFVLFYVGDISLLNDNTKKLAVVGSRKASEKFKAKTREIIINLYKDIVIVSGLAKGIDGIAHKSAIESNKKTIAIIGSGLDYTFPSENAELYSKIKQNHLLLSEYPEYVPPCQDNFPWRNRIIAGLSKAVFIPEAKHKSGTVITAGYAINMGKEILCLPSENFGDSACNVFLKEGARLVENADDVMEFLL